MSGTFVRTIATALSAAGAFVMPANAQQRPSLTRPDVERLADSVFRQYLQSASPSLSLIVVRGDSVLLAKGYGLEDADAKRPVSPDSSVFHIASVSKLFVATAVMQMVDAGTVGLDDPIDKHLSGLRLPSSTTPITVRHLLTHTSGIDAPFMKDVVAEPKQLVSLAEYFRRNPPRLGRTPGSEIRYSNHGMALAALIVERVSGEPFDAYVERHIFGPLGMAHSSFRQPPPRAIASRVATAGAGTVPNAMLIYPAGSMVSTAGDMGRFMRAQLNGGARGDVRILSSTSAASMQSRQWSANARVPGVGLGFFETDLGGLRGLFHTGARTHFSLLYLQPDQRVGVFLVHSMRQGGPFQRLRQEFVGAFVKRYFAHDSGIRLASMPSTVGGAERFAGVYRPVIVSSTTIERAAWLGADTRVSANVDGSLDVAIPAGRTLHVTQESPGVYRARTGPDEGLAIAFSDTAGGRLTRMSLSGATQDPVSFDRLPWYQRGKLHAVVLALAYALLSTFFIAALLTQLVTRMRRHSPSTVGDSPTERRAWRLAMYSSVMLFMAPIVGATLMIVGQNDGAAADGLRRALTAGLALILCGSVLALGTIPFSVIAWRGRYWTSARRVYYAVLAAAASCLIPLLGYYHLLGFWL